MTRFTSIAELKQQCSADVQARNGALFAGVAETKEVKRSKYGNVKVEHEGVLFDSQKELSRWLELQLMERGGAISDLQRQVWFDLAGGIRMRLDATYKQDGKRVAEDVKGVVTRDWKNKAKLFAERYGHEWELRIV